MPKATIKVEDFAELSETAVYVADSGTVSKIARTSKEGKPYNVQLFSVMGTTATGKTVNIVCWGANAETIFSFFE